ncbi:hypothetical protein CI102_6521 [Trichoderma harzianum]|nr:hypothetical protein CI102_6521 [Trichoderma harzianum]
MLGYALGLLNTRPLRVSIGSSSILFPRQLFIPMHNGCCIRHHRGHILAQGCPALSLPCLCLEPLSSPTNRSVEELAVTDTWSSAMATACLLTYRHTEAEPTRWFWARKSPSFMRRHTFVVPPVFSRSIRCTSSVVFSFLFPLACIFHGGCSSCHRLGGVNYNPSYNPKGIRIFSV